MPHTGIIPQTLLVRIKVTELRLWYPRHHAFTSQGHVVTRVAYDHKFYRCAMSQVETRSKKEVACTDDDEEATTGDMEAIDEVQTKMQEAILLVPGLASNTSRALAAALVAAGINDADMLREITTEEVEKVMLTLATYKDGGYPMFLPKNVGIKIRAICLGTPTRRSPSGSRHTNTPQHTATTAAVAIDSIKPSVRLAQDTENSRPGLAKVEDFCYAHIKPYSPYEQALLQAYEELKSSWYLTKQEATRLGSDIDPLVGQSLSNYLVKNMGLHTYQTYVKPHLTKEERECPILIIWQLLSEARKISEIDLSNRYTALLQPTRATSIAQLTALYQQQIDEETELRLHSFVTDGKAKALKEAFLELSANYPVLLTKIEIVWQGERDNPPAALDLVKAEVVSFFSTQPAGPEYTPATRPQTAGQESPAMSRPRPKATAPIPSHGLPRMLPTGRLMGSQATDNVCRQFKSRGSCTYGDKCRYSHSKEALAMLAEVHDSDEEDIVVEMFQQSNMAVAEPQITMAVLNGISGFDSDE